MAKARAKTARPAKTKEIALMKERGSPRGLVPVSGALDHTYNEYLDSIGIRDPKRAPIVEFALASSNDGRFREFLNKLKHPFWSSANGRSRKPLSLATLAKACDISLPQWAEFWQKAQHMRALAAAQDGAVEIMPDMVADAKSKEAPCDRCDGWGWVYADDVPAKFAGVRRLNPKDPKDKRQIRVCPLCKGSKSVGKTGDTDSRKMLLEVGGFTSKKGSAIQITQHFGGMGMESAVDRLNKVSFSLEEDIIDVKPEPTDQNSDSESSL